jgi:hypothetical protein
LKRFIIKDSNKKKQQKIQTERLQEPISRRWDQAQTQLSCRRHFQSLTKKRHREKLPLKPWTIRGIYQHKATQWEVGKAIPNHIHLPPGFSPRIFFELDNPHRFL